MVESQLWHLERLSAALYMYKIGIDIKFSRNCGLNRWACGQSRRVDTFRSNYICILRTCLYDIYLLAVFLCCRSWEKMRICYEELIGDCRLDPEAVSVLRAHIERFRVYSLPCRHQNPNQLHSQSPVDLLSRPYFYSVPLLSIYNHQYFSKYFSRYFSDCFN